MDTHSHFKITPSGHDNQGVHVCHKCGWAFPKLHPSAKQRRAHKRICGTIQGYKLSATHSTVSDDEPSDEDRRTPSPKIDESRSIIGSGSCSGGVGERSEDEVFSDAVAEFSDNGVSPGSEEPERKSVHQTTMVDDMGRIEALKGDTVTDSDKAVSSLQKNYEVRNDNARTDIALIHYCRPQEVAVSASSLNDSSCDFSLVESEAAVNAPSYVFEVHGTNNGNKQKMTCIVEKHLTPEKDKVAEFLVDSEEPQNEIPSESPEAESDLQELDSKTSYSGPTNGLVESTQSARVEAELSVHSYLPLFEPVESIEAFVNTLEIRDTERETKEVTRVQSVANDLPVVEHAVITLEDLVGHNALRSDFSYVNRTLDIDDGGKLEDPYTLQSIMPDKRLTEFESRRAVDNVSHLSRPAERVEVFVSTAHMKVDPIQDKHPGPCGDLFEIHDTNRETMHVLTVVSDLPIVEHADIMLKNYKDHHSTFRPELSPDLGSHDVVRHPEGDNDVIVMEENPSNLHLSKPDGVTNPLADMNDLEEDMITIEGSEKGVADTFKFSATTDNILDSDGVESLPCTSRSEKENIQTNCSLQVVPHHKVSLMISSHNDEVSQTTRLNHGNNNNENEMARAEDVVTEGNGNSEGVPAIEHSTKANINFLREDSNQITKSSRQNNGGKHVAFTMELSDEAWIEKSTEAAAVEKFATATTTELEPEPEFFYSNYSASVPDTPVSSITTVVVNVMPAHPGPRIFSGYDCKEVNTEPQINSESEVVAKCGDGGIVDFKFCHSVDTEVAEDNSKKPVMILDSETPHGSSGGVKTEHGRENIVPEPMQENDGKLAKQTGGASALDISVDSSSQTDSVEGNWGSVSVLSVQSVSSWTEAQLKTDPEGPDKSGSTTLHQKIAFERQVSGNAVVYETPSFMTMVERTGGADRKAVTSEIKLVHGTEQPKSEALQSGWFPSLSNVVNQSVGRKKNEEITNLTNWSTGKQHSSTPLKNLLGEAKLETKTKSPSPTCNETKIQNDERDDKSNVRLAAVNVKDVLASEAPAAAEQIVKRETAEEWNSPARYPVEIRKEKKKAKGKPSWLPFVCCSSVN